MVTIRCRSRADRAVASPPGSFVSATTVTGSRYQVRPRPPRPYSLLMTDKGTGLPDYADLPTAAHGGRSAWGLFGADDNLGLVNLMTADRIAAAARLVQKGTVFCLDMPLGSISPALA